MKFQKYGILSLITALILINPTSALIKMDDTSIDLAIKYGLKMKDASTRERLGPNWINDNSGKSLYVYSPFIQLVAKSTKQASSGNIDSDVISIKKTITPYIKGIQTKNEIRYIIDLHGDSTDFAKNYKAQVVSANNYINKETSTLNPKKSNIQTIADKDNYDVRHPFSAVNVYTFKFDEISKFKEYYLIITSDKGIQTQFIIDNSKIF